MTSVATPTPTALETLYPGTPLQTVVPVSSDSHNPSDPYSIQYRGPYGYLPVLSAPILFATLFFLSTLAHLYKTLRTAHWWLLVLVLGCLAEAGGHALRIYGHHDPFPKNPFVAMQVLLVITPVFFAAIDFAILARVSVLFPVHLSLVRPSYILPFFVTLDILSLIIQAVGSAFAAFAQIEGKDTMPGSRIIVAGLAIQLLGYLCFNVLLITFYRRVRKPTAENATLKDWNQRLNTFLIATFLSSLLILVRSIFRLVEMSVGWIGAVAHHEWAFYAFDATPVAMAVLILNYYFPGDYLPKAKGSQPNDEEDHPKQGNERRVLEEKAEVESPNNPTESIQGPEDQHQPPSPSSTFIQTPNPTQGKWSKA
ncbi:RTA1-domain-containing protein [Violaceomyces palustris]|uniref:RTA1-domain-containing protein n=1 Tax=Violaceomyces palustris TaxID=1673888 RepID=A0ACD0NNK1_9BASI|nr:RTA1-domain-containing protein [Violaceomyces palustris]